MIPSISGIALWHTLLCLPSSLAFNQVPIFNHDDPVLAGGWKLNYSSSAPHYFASVYGLLQQWPNTFFPNGHSIVPCQIPPFTKLYHGRMDGNLPPSPEWVAFDIAMSYGIMGSSRNSHMLTYQTTRPTECIYFDGESATLFGTGQLDVQMLHIYGNTSGPPERGWGLWDEYGRARGLCKWLQEQNLGGLGWGYEGIVRMNAGFEMIWCNFTSPSIRLISHLNVTAPLLPPIKEMITKANIPTSLFPLPPTSTSSGMPVSSSAIPRPSIDWSELWREPFVADQTYRWYLSSTLHYGSSGEGPGLGETRVKLSTCGFLSYYDPTLSSQMIPRVSEERRKLNLTSSGFWTGPGNNGTRPYALQMLARRRRLHVLDKVSSVDAAIMRTNSENLLRASLDPYYSNCSGVDWYVLTNGVVQDYAGPIFRFLNSLEQYENSTSSNKTLLKDWMMGIRREAHTFLLPFMEYPRSDEKGQEWKRDSKHFQIVYSRCRYQHTRLLQPDEGIFLGPEESLLRWAVEETQGSICSVLIDIGFAIEATWLSKFNQATTSLLDSKTVRTLKGEVRRWKEGVEELMAWLGWVGEWTGCEEKCAWDETCYIPMWPLIPWGGGRGPRRPPGNGTWPGNGTFTGFPPYRFPGNGTMPRRNFNPWGDSEADLWQPKCTKLEFFLTGKRT